MKCPYIEHAASGLPNPTHLEGGVRFVQAQDQQVTTRSQINSPSNGYATALAAFCIHFTCQLSCMHLKCIERAKWTELFNAYQPYF